MTHKLLPRVIFRVARTKKSLFLICSWFHSHSLRRFILSPQNYMRRILMNNIIMDPQVGWKRFISVECTLAWTTVKTMIPTIFGFLLVLQTVHFIACLYLIITLILFHFSFYLLFKLICLIVSSSFVIFFCLVLISNQRRMYNLFVFL